MFMVCVVLGDRRSERVYSEWAVVECDRKPVSLALPVARGAVLAHGNTVYTIVIAVLVDHF